ncbi:hypothetical protein BSL78_09398 [Apostichopus japonicus]|uniref:Uncharacterized protein n=1 Tax=Stichopus japonicus TaxID=307972 RepID=A0A2G8L091_STIJA|nr:hypothetical protein BSL78_09398 [Apostichopus japonicus]
MMFENVPVIGNLVPWLLSVLIALAVIGILAWIYCLMKTCSLVRQEASIPLREEENLDTGQENISPANRTNFTSSQSFRVKAPTYASYDFHPHPPPSLEVISTCGGEIWPQEGEIFHHQVDCSTQAEAIKFICTMGPEQHKVNHRLVWIYTYIYSVPLTLFIYGHNGFLLTYKCITLPCSGGY